jgi:DNA-binding Lrp family transcriptional regulator
MMWQRVGNDGEKVFLFFPEISRFGGRFHLIDAIDEQILAELQSDGRLTVTELAGRVGLSVSPCHRRMRELERAGVITGYRALVDPGAIGLGFEVVVLVTMRRADSPTVEEFERYVAEIPNVTHAQRLFGDPDYLLRVLCTDIADYQRLWDEALGKLPGVGRFNSTMVMKHIVADRPASPRP